MNYTELVELLQQYTETREASFVANIPRFVKQAEQRVYRTVMLPELRKNATTQLTPSSPYLDRPSDFLSVFSMSVVDEDGEFHFLYDKDVNFIREAYPSPTDTGLPKFYAQFDGRTTADTGTFLLGPTPDQNYNVELHYYYDPPSIVDTGTSWLGDNAETVLLYGAMVEAYTYLKGEADLMAQYKARYEEALSLLTGIEVRSKRDDYKDGQMGRGA